MQVFNDINELRITGQTYLTIGNFDGLHRGHQALLKELLALAKAQPGHARSALLTFDPHPLAILQPDRPLQLLTSAQDRIRLAGQIGIEIGLIQPFSHAIAALTPLEFMTLLKTHLGLAGLVVGPDFALGRDRAGDLDALREIGQTLGYTVTVIEPISWQDRTVRSSVIRQDIRDGNVSEARQLLGRRYTVEGPVEIGDRRGHQIGVATANIHTAAEILLPCDGVYASLSTIDPYGQARTFQSVTNIGVRPTVDGHNRRIETHLLDFPLPGEPDNIYGQTVRVEFVERLRGEQRFTNIDALVAQIQSDIRQARVLFSAADEVGLSTAIDIDGH